MGIFLCGDLEDEVEVYGDTVRDDVRDARYTILVPFQLSVLSWSAEVLQDMVGTAGGRHKEAIYLANSLICRVLVIFRFQIAAGAGKAHQSVASTSIFQWWKWPLSTWTHKGLLKSFLTLLHCSTGEQFLFKQLKSLPNRANVSPQKCGFNMQIVKAILWLFFWVADNSQINSVIPQTFPDVGNFLLWFYAKSVIKQFSISALGLFDCSLIFYMKCKVTGIQVRTSHVLGLKTSLVIYTSCHLYAYSVAQGFFSCVVGFEQIR